MLPASVKKQALAAVAPLRSCFALLVLCTFAGALAEDGRPDEPPWQRPDAEVRLRVSAATFTSHLLRVDLPEDCRGRDVKGVCAYQTEGDMIPASPIRLGSRIIAVECLVPRIGRWAASRRWSDRDSGPPLPIEIYLLPSEDVPLPCPGEERQPVLLERTFRRLVTRPFAAAELTRLTAQMIIRRAMSADVKSLGASPAKPDWLAGDGGNSGQSGQRAAIMHWAAAFLLQTDVAFYVGADQAQVAWFLLLDGLPVVDWMNGKGLPGGGRRSRRQKLEAGLHRVDFFAIQRPDEPLPVPLYSAGEKDFLPLPADELYSVRQPDAILVERKKRVLQVGLRLHEVRRYIVKETAAEILTFEVDEIGRNFFKRGVVARSLRVGDQAPVTALDKVFATTGAAIPRLELTLTDEHEYEQTAVLPERRVWLRPSVVAPKLRLGPLPPVLAADKALTVPVSVELASELLTSFEGRLTVDWRQSGPAGRVLASGAADAPAPGKILTLEIPLHRSATLLELTYAAAGAPLTRSSAICVLHPQSTFDDLLAHAAGLFREGRPAVLVANPLKRLRTAAPAGNGGAEADGELVIVDDFWAVALGPNADVFPEKWLARSGATAVSRHSITDRGGDGAARPVRKFSLLGKILAEPGGVVLWAVGANEERAGLDPEEICLHLLFLAQATHAAKRRPVLMALPSIPDVPEARSRRVALLTKELAYKLGVPVVDAYSRAKKEKESLGGFADLFCSYDRTISLATPNNVGRVWLCRLLEEGLTQTGVPALHRQSAIAGASLGRLGARRSR